jgi:hypothetical protein
MILKINDLDAYEMWMLLNRLYFILGENQEIGQDVPLLMKQCSKWMDAFYVDKRHVPKWQTEYKKYIKDKYENIENKI